MESRAQVPARITGMAARAGILGSVRGSGRGGSVEGRVGGGGTAPTIAPLWGTNHDANKGR